MVSARGRLTIVDFGIARLLEDNSPRLTAADADHRHVAVHVARAGRRASTWTAALGPVLLRLRAVRAAGRPPAVRGPGPDAPLMRMHLQERPVPLRDVRLRPARRAARAGRPAAGEGPRRAAAGRRVRRAQPGRAISDNLDTRSRRTRPTGDFPGRDPRPMPGGPGLTLARPARPRRPDAPGPAATGLPSLAGTRSPRPDTASRTWGAYQADRACRPCRRRPVRRRRAGLAASPGPGRQARTRARAATGTAARGLAAPRGRRPPPPLGRRAEQPAHRRHRGRHRRPTSGTRPTRP